MEVSRPESANTLPAPLLLNIGQPQLVRQYPIGEFMKSIYPSILLAGALAALAVTGAISQEPAGESAQSAKKAAKKKALPLQATRKIEFTTDEATWLSLDVSPDGQTIVFELLGDLYTVPIAGGLWAQFLPGITPGR